MAALRSLLTEVVREEPTDQRDRQVDEPPCGLREAGAVTKENVDQYLPGAFS
ncbi:hypothetical protein [Streptomyces aureus]|uniref:hypothetical protein n=1 Tax=Streptomyces aureus TaxID=193461 RepID=UPI003624C6ED